MTGTVESIRVREMLCELSEEPLLRGRRPSTFGDAQLGGRETSQASRLGQPHSRRSVALTCKTAITLLEGRRASGSRHR